MPTPTDPKNIKKIIAHNIKKYRKKLGITQEEAAERSDITAHYWQRLELISQTDLPSLLVLFKVSDVLNIKPYQLLKE